MQRQCESMEIENIKMAEKLKELMNMQMNNSNTGAHMMYCTPKVGKQQNKKVLEEDGIRCFDLDKQSMIMQDDLNADELDLRQSIGLSCKSKASKKSNSTIMKIQAPVPN